LQLTQEEAEERIQLEQHFNLDDDDDDLDSDDSYDEAELAKKQQRMHDRIINKLKRKYIRIRKALDTDKLFFQDDIFIIEPEIGKI